MIKLNIAQQLAHIKNRIAEYETYYSRESGSVTLLAVSKKQSLDNIVQAIAAGQKAFGESYLQEALGKINALKAYPLEWHFIGPMQRNKIKKIAEHFDWVHSVSSREGAERLNFYRSKAVATLKPLNICLQVNISQENTKSGINPEELVTLADYCHTLPFLKLRGIMAIPHKVDQENHLANLTHLKRLFDRLKNKFYAIDTLSMGMSNDLEAAIAAGSTLVRIGESIFGQRETGPAIIP